MQTGLLIAIVVYLIVVGGMAVMLQSKIRSEEDFLIGGRSFGLWLTTFSLFATWFGAGTLIAATDEVFVEGLKITALEPYGAGMCLVFSSFLLAKPLWKMGIMTYSDFYRIKFGERVEVMSVFINIPVYVGWIAVQIITLANILHAFFPLPIWVLIAAISLLSLALTMSGGLWSVSITDSFQLSIIIGGLVYLFFKVFGFLPESWMQLISAVEPAKLVILPTDNLPELMAWLSLFSVAALGNMTGQDMVQRMLSARSAEVARTGCLLAGLMYILFGSIPVLLGLTAGVTLGEVKGSVVPELIESYLDPVSAVVLIMTIVSAVVSTITSALLAPSSLLSHNFLKTRFPQVPLLALSRWSVAVIMALSLLTVVLGEDVYSLLENSYAIGFVGFFVPMTIGVFTPYLNERACIVSMSVSILVWLGEFLFGGDVPYALIAVAAGYPVYFIVYNLFDDSKVSV
jgi:SSS family solute:Na+ symporter